MIHIYRQIMENFKLFSQFLKQNSSEYFYLFVRIHVKSYKHMRNIIYYQITKQTLKFKNR